MTAEANSPIAPIKRILVTGDAGTDLDIYLQFSGPNPPPGAMPTRIGHSLGGAGLAYRILTEWAGKQAAAIGFAPPLQPASPVFAIWNLKPLGGSYTGKPPAFETGWRVMRSVNPGEIALQNDVQMPQSVMPPAAGADFIPEVILIQDAAATYRHPRGNVLPVAPYWSDPKTFVVWKMSPPLCRGDLWWESKNAKVPERALAVVTLSDLRCSPVRISGGISWERTALELVRELEVNPALADLRHFAHVIIPIYSEGALWRRQGRDGSEYTLFFDARHMEHEFFKSGEWEGGAYGYSTVFTAALTAGLSASQRDPQDALPGAIRNGLHAMRLLHVLGHGPDVGNPDFPVKPIVEVVRFGKAGLSGFHAKAFGEFADVPVPLPEALAPASEWAIALSDPHRPAGEPLYGLARRVAVYGESQLRDIPHACFGKLMTADRHEIEALRNLKTLMDDYVRDTDMTKPLSLAVFGPPGAGKSFGVKEIAHEVLGKKCHVLEFNLSQFTEADLAGAFHQVRDKVLEGKMPVVFWDEFDSSEYKWLRLLLAPMNDGKFQEGQLTHPIGRCIFIFAGGTSPDLESFGVQAPAATIAVEAPEAKAWRQFQLLKGPDFISRIHGSLNVLGPNPKRSRATQAGTGTAGIQDVEFPLRRAILLRALLGCKGCHRLEMESGLLSAMLEVGAYSNGARSFEKICLALRTAAGKDGPYRPSHLPADAVLGMNVTDLTEFKNLLTRDEAFKSQAHLLAKVFHDVWRAGKRAKLGSKSFNYDCEFDDLPIDKKNDNIDAAMRMPRNLLLGGYRLVPGKPAGKDTTAEIPAHLVEIMAQEEHYQWMENAVANGMRQQRPGELRNDQQLIHDCILAWTDLPEDIREYDRWFIRKYPEFAESAGFSIVTKKP